jgi:hypothetical protein
MLQAIANLGGWLLMMGQHDRSESLFYYFRIEDQVPENHLLRFIDRYVSFDFVREKLRASYSETGRPSIGTTVSLGELGDLLQSCLSSDEAHRLITDRSRVLFPNSCGAVCITASSRDLVEVVASWGEPALRERFFPPKDCWALRRGCIHLLECRPDGLSCAHVAERRPQWAMCATAKASSAS